ncbi:MAG: hypothetical protein AAGN66_06370 [Acidobacteriota bacterium]
MKHKVLATFAAVAVLLALAGPAVASQQQWIHVKIQGDDDEQVIVNLPLTMLKTAAAMIPPEAHREAEIAFDDVGMDWQELQDMWQSIKDAPEATFVTVQTRDEHIAVKKDGDFVVIKTTESQDGGTHIDVQIPLSVVDALLSGTEGSLDFMAALDALAAYGPGQLVSIRDGNETVDVWIDYENEAR